MSVSAMLNNLCGALIAYGSYMPGAAKHNVFASLPGRWQKGKILASRGDHPDDIASGETDAIEAWMLEFSDCTAQLFTAEFEQQKRLLFNRWLALDEVMGPNWVRTQRRWWPADVAPVPDPTNMQVVNIYLPLARFPHLAEQDDPVAPNDQGDLEKLWRQVKAGQKKYDWCEFAYFLSDCHPNRFQDLFGDLPKGDRFIARLSRLCEADHLDPSVAFTDQQCLAQTLRTEERTIDEALEIVRRHLKQQVALLRWRGFHAEAQALDLVPARQGSGYAAAPEFCEAFAAWELSFDIVIDAKERDDHWLYCLQEACGGLTRHNFATHWLIRDWLDLPVDLEPIKELFVARYWFQIDGEACNVFKVR